MKKTGPLVLVALLAVGTGVLLDRTVLRSETASVHAGGVSYICPMHPDVITDDPEMDCPICGMNLVEAPDGSPDVEAPKQYVCPMHPDVVTDDRDMDCPVCGMNLVAAPEKAPASFSSAASVSLDAGKTS